MPFTPASILWMWLRGLFSIAVIAGLIALLTGWYRDLPHQEVVIVKHDTEVIREVRVLHEPSERIAAWRPGFDAETAMLVGGLLLLAFSTTGTLWSPRLFRKRGLDEPKDVRNGEVQRINRPDGTVLEVECYGRPDAPPVIFTHGWGLDSSIWYYVKKQFSERFRVIVWDLPGFGLSTRPKNNDHSLEKMGQDLRAIVEFAGNRPVVLVGHSIGGMIGQTFCRLFPDLLRSRISGLVLTHTTYINPVRTMRHSAFYTAIEKPVLVPLMHLTIWLSPLVWLMNCLSYLNGSAHRSTERESFAGTETRGQLDFSTRFLLKASPGILARGILDMLRFNANDVLSKIPVPALVIAGDEDGTTKPEASEHIASEIPAGQLATLSPAKHQGFFEHKERFAELTAEFCGRVLGSRGAEAARMGEQLQAQR